MKLSLNVLKDEKAPVVALTAVAIKTYGKDAFELDPALLRKEIEEDFSISMSDLQADKMQLGLRILSSDSFENQWEVFRTGCHLFNNTYDTFDTFEMLEAEEIACALAHYYLLIGDDKEKAQFSADVRAFAGKIFHDYGLSEAPMIFPTAIMPEGVKADPAEKNKALNEIFDARKVQILDYMKDLWKD